MESQAAIEPNGPRLSNDEATPVNLSLELAAATVGSLDKSAKRRRGLQQDDPEDGSNRPFKKPARSMTMALPPVGNEDDELSSDAEKDDISNRLIKPTNDSDSDSDSDATESTTDEDGDKIMVLLEVPGQDGGKKEILVISEEEYELFTQIESYDRKVPSTTPESDLPGSSTARRSRKTSPHIEAVGAKMHFNKLQLIVTTVGRNVRTVSGDMHIWCRLDELVAQWGGMSLLEKFVKSAAFLKAGGSGKNRAKIAWELFLQGKPTSDIPYTEPVSLPSESMFPPKMPVAMMLVDGEWLVCVKAKLADFEQRHWINDKKLLDACVACCVEQDWSEVIL